MKELLPLVLGSCLFILFGLKIVSYLITYYKLKKNGFKYLGIVTELKVFHDSEGFVPTIELKNHSSEKVIKVIKCYFGDFYNVKDEVTIYLRRDIDDDIDDDIECVIDSSRQIFKLVLSLLSFITVYSLIIIAYFFGW